METIISFVDYADDKFGRKNGQYEKTQKTRSKFLNQFNLFHRIFNWNWYDLSQLGFSIPRAREWNGASFKPIIILESLNKIPQGSFLLYYDCSPENTLAYPTGPLSIKDPNQIPAFISDLSEDIDFLCPLHPFVSKNWTKSDCFKLMDCDSPVYFNSLQVCTCWILMRKTPGIINFIKEWLSYNLNTDIASYKPSTHCNDSEYYNQNRGDQSIVNNLMIKHEKKCCYIKDPFLAETKDFGHFLQASENQNLSFSLIPDIKI